MKKILIGGALMTAAAAVYATLAVRRMLSELESAEDRDEAAAR